MAATEVMDVTGQPASNVMDAMRERKQ